MVDICVFTVSDSCARNSRRYSKYILKSEKPPDTSVINQDCEEENHRWSRDASKEEPPTR